MSLRRLKRLLLPVIVLVPASYYGLLALDERMSSDLAVYNQCELNQKAKAFQAEAIGVGWPTLVGQGEGISFFDKYFKPQLEAITLAAQEKYGADFQFDCGNSKLSTDYLNFLQKIYPDVTQLHLDHMLKMADLKKDIINAEEKLRTQQVKESVYIQMDIDKYCFFVRMRSRTNQSLAQLKKSCASPQKRKIASCEKSYRKFNSELIVEANNLEKNHHILVEKWHPYQEWIEEQVNACAGGE